MHELAKDDEDVLAYASRCGACREGPSGKCWWSSELMASLRIRRIPRLRFGFPLVLHALEFAPWAGS